MDHEKTFSIRLLSTSAPDISVLRFDGKEAMNELSSTEIIAYSIDVEESRVSSHLLGSGVVLSMRVPAGAPRTLAGIVADVAWLGRMENGRHGFRLRVVPRSWLLTRRTNTRIFQNRTAAEIASVILAEHHVPFRLALVGKYPVREYCVQYQESDWDFIARLFAEEALFFWFENPPEDGAEEVLVVADSPRAYGTISGSERLRFRHDTGGSLTLEEDMVTAFQARFGLETTALTLSDYDFERPALPLTATGAADGAPPHPLGGAPLEHYEHHGEYEETDVDVDNLRAGLTQIRARTATAEGCSVCRRLAPGLTFRLVDHDIAALDIRYVVHAVHHHGSSTPADGEVEYENRLEVVAADRPFPPPRPPRRVKQTLESATVTGPPGQEIYCDPHGRVKVQFHWDRDRKNDDTSSCFLRVAQSWAGSGFGAQLVPRVGMEVLVGFLGGDPDRPIVVACVPNAHNPPPYSLPAGNTRSVLRSRSSPGGGGFNEISLEDRRGSEQLYVHAERDLDEEVGRNRASTIGQDASLTVGGDLTTTVTGHRRESTRGDHRISIDGGRTTTLGGGDRSETSLFREARIDGPDTLQVKGSSATHVEGSRTVRVDGHDELRVEGNHAVVVQGRDERDVMGTSRTTFSGACSVNAARGISLTVGSSGAPATAEGALTGDLVLRGTGNIEIAVKRQVRLRVGSTVLTLSPKELRIEAETVTLNGKSITARASKSALSLGDGAAMEGETIKLASKDEAVLELDKEAKIDGEKVKIKPGLAAEMARREEREEAKRDLEKVEVTLFDLAGERIEGAPYEVSFAGYFDEGVSASGTVEIPAFPDVETARVRWGRPESAREAKGADPYEFEIEVYLKTDADDPKEALRRKLENLGHRGASLHDAVRHYQASIGADVTGDPADIEADIQGRHDAATPAKLRAE